MDELNLQLKMYLTLILMFALGYSILYVALTLLGASVSIFIGFAALMLIAQWYIGPAMIKFASKLRYIDKNEYPDLHKMVEELANEAKVPVPRIAISPSMQPNAFVFGRTRKSATLAVHQGLLSILDNNEIYSVLAHEIGHIRHNDFTIMTIISFVPMLAWILAENMFLSGMLGGNRNNGAYLMLIGIASFVVYAVSQLFMLSLSRTRESFADEYSANTTRKPEDLASALFKISVSSAKVPPQQQKGMTTTTERALCIIDVFGNQKNLEMIKQHASEIKKILPNVKIEDIINNAEKEMKGPRGIMNSLFSTHPPTYKRLLDLAEIKASLN